MESTDSSRSSYIRVAIFPWLTNMLGLCLLSFCDVSVLIYRNIFHKFPIGGVFSYVYTKSLYFGHT